MATRKKGKKSKWQPVPLQTLIPQSAGGFPAMPKMTSSWADEPDDDHESFASSMRKTQEAIVLPSAPRAARGPGIDEENIPLHPPFVAYVSNLPYDVLEEDLVEFFADMQVANMRLPKDSTKLRGYGYVDFEDRQSLIDALSMANSSIKGRRVRIEVSNSNSDDRRSGRMGMGRDYGRRENSDDADRNTDWRAGPRDEPSSDGDRFRSHGSGFDRDRREDRETSASDNKPGAWREGRSALPDLPDRGSSSFSERRGYRSDDKDREFSRFSDRGSRDRFADRGGDRGGDRSGFGQRSRAFGDRERSDDSDWRNRPSSRAPSVPGEEPQAPEPAHTRVKLKLEPRTKPIDPPIIVKDNSEQEKSNSDGAAPGATATPVPATNIFGAAKPVDTTAREREIEERLARSYPEAKPKSEEGDRKGPAKEGTWGRRNGEGRGDNDRERSRPTWRSDEDRGKHADSRPTNRQPYVRADQRNDSRGPVSSNWGPRGGPRSNDGHRGPSEKERKDRDEREERPMPKAVEDQAPNFVASNKYSMLPVEVDSDNNDN